VEAEGRKGAGPKKNNNPDGIFTCMSTPEKTHMQTTARSTIRPSVHRPAVLDGARREEREKVDEEVAIVSWPFIVVLMLCEGA
jgi:hypothetical protein